VKGYDSRNKVGKNLNANILLINEA